MSVNNKLSSACNEATLKRDLVVAEAKILNLENTFANLSHSLKGSIFCIQSSLRNILEDSDRASHNRFRAERALRNLALMKKLAFSINHSYSGSIEDFIFDAHNPVEQTFGFQQLILHVLYTGLNNIFDGMNFGKFQARYFPRTDERETLRNLLIQAKKDLQAIDDNSIDDFLNYAAKYFFDLEIRLNGVEDYLIGDTKGSAMKMLILFQEIIFNAIKYASFAEHQARKLLIVVEKSADNISIIVTNSFSSGVKAKSTGIGHHIIENMTKIMNGEYQELKGDKEYSVQVTIPDFWKNDNRKK